MKKLFRFIYRYLYYLLVPILGGLVSGFIAICKMEFHFNELSKLETWISSFLVTYFVFSIVFIVLNAIPKMKNHMCINSSISFILSTVVGMISYTFKDLPLKDKVLLFTTNCVIGLFICGGGFLLAFFIGRTKRIKIEYDLSDKFIKKFKKLPERRRQALLGTMVARMECENELLLLMQISNDKAFKWTINRAVLADEKLAKDITKKKEKNK